jgi:hypothetical protein
MSAQSGEFKRGSNHELYDLNPAADADPKFLPSSRPLRHFVTNYDEKRTIRETNQNEANSNRAQRPLLVAKFLLLCASLFGTDLV